MTPAQAAQVIDLAAGQPAVIALDGDEAGAAGTARWLNQICLQRHTLALATRLPAEALASGQEDLGRSTRVASVRARIAELDRRIAALLTAVEDAGDIPALTEQLKKRTRERDGLMAQATAERGHERLDAEQMRKALDDLGGIAAILSQTQPMMRAKLYASLGVRLEYDHNLKRIRATAAQACVLGRVWRGTCPHETHTLSIQLS